MKYNRNIFKIHNLILTMLTMLAVGCHATPSSRPSSLSTPPGASESADNQSHAPFLGEVTYGTQGPSTSRQNFQENPNLTPGSPVAQNTAPNMDLNIPILPSDLVFAYKKSCKLTICQATFEKPFKAKLDLSLPLSMKVTVTYEAAADQRQAIISHQFKVAGQLVSLDIAKILKVGVKVFADFEMKKSNDFKPQFECQGLATCDSPILQVSAMADSRGMTFSSDIKPNLIDFCKSIPLLKDLVGNSLGKNAKKLTYAEIQAITKAVLLYYKDRPLPQNRAAPDINWEPK